MKINKLNPTGDQAISKGNLRNSLPTSQTLFADAIKEHEQANNDLQIVLAQIDEFARKLRQQKNLHNLHIYKRAIRAFLRMVLDTMYDVEDKRFVDRYGRRRACTLVATIDQRLEELTRDVLGKQHSTIELAHCLDEIRGLLLDIVS